MEGCCSGLAASDEVFALHDPLKNAADRPGYDLGHTPTDVGPFHTVGDTAASVDPKRLRESGEGVVQALLEMGASE